MTVEDFETQLRDLLNRQPFQPFLVEDTHGDRFLVDIPDSVAFSGGAAGFISANDGVFFFDHSNVRQFLPAAWESRP